MAVKCWAAKLNWLSRFSRKLEVRNDGFFKRVFVHILCVNLCVLFEKFSFNRRLSFAGVYVQIDGEANTQWNKGTRSHPVIYTSSEKYIDERTYLVDGRNGMNQQKYKYCVLCLD